MYRYVYIYIYIDIYNIPLNNKPPSAFRSAQGRAYDDRAYTLSLDNSHVPTLCPAVICPYLFASDIWYQVGERPRPSGIVLNSVET